MENIFEKLLGRAARFGDWFITYDRMPLRYIKRVIGQDTVMMFNMLNSEIEVYSLDGKLIDEDGNPCERHVVNVHNPIDEADLRVKATDWTSFVKSNDLMIKTIAMECACIGYRKAIEEVII